MDEEKVLLKDILKENGDEAYIEEQCHDCGLPVQVKITLDHDQDQETYLFEAQGGAAQYAPQINGETVFYYKCHYCYDKAPTLKGWRPCSVYSRIVGYMQELDKWNVGKREEYKQRKTYNIFDSQ